jgi:caa(3)-type oxidase subunit IV
VKHDDPTKEALQPRHSPGSRTYLLVFAALAILTVVEVGVSYLTGGLKISLLLIMSAAKAALVILYFMHLKYDSRWFAFIFLSPLALVIPMIWIALIR